jgi:hypothetical protein
MNNTISDFTPEISEKFEEGFNLKVLIASLFIGLIMLPGSIYLGLITGGGLGGAAQWVAVILLAEIAKRSFVQLKKQEVYILYILSGTIMSSAALLGTAGLILPGGAFAQLIWNQYIIQSPYAHFFHLAHYLPGWVAPHPGSAALIKRTFFSSVWLTPILIIIASTILYQITSFSLGYVLFRLTSDREKLLFPMAPVAAEGATALAETTGKKEGWRWRIFSISAMIGLIFGAIYIVVPAVTGLFMAKPLQLIPIPWVDLTPQISSMFPASMLGFATDIGVIIIGFVLPFWVVVGMFVASILSQTIGNPILYKMGMLKNWEYGMSAIPTNIVTTMNFWINAFIGIGITVGLIGILTMFFTTFRKKNNKDYTKEQTSLPEGRGDYPIPFAILIWFIATLLYVVLCHKLVPSFSVMVFVFFGFILTPFLSYASARMFGTTGSPTGVSFPFVKESTFLMSSYASGYKGSSIWFAPVPYNDFGGMPQGFRQLELTKTKFTSWYKAQIAAVVIMLLCGLLFWSIIWHFAPIPSSTYPYAQMIWPMNALFNTLWATSTLGRSSWLMHSLNVKYIFGSTLTGFILFGILSLTTLPISFFYGLVAGIVTMPQFAIPMFIGALLSRFYFSKKIGKETWARYAPIILAGYYCGEGLIGMFAVAIALIVKTIYHLIF